LYSSLERRDSLALIVNDSYVERLNVLELELHLLHLGFDLFLAFVSVQELA
jgi:hypothetical protein